LRAPVPALLLLVACSSTTVTTPQAWLNALANSGESIKRGEYARSLKTADRVLWEMRDLLGSGEQESAILGLALTHKALALAGLGRTTDALWYWQSVIGVYPQFAKSDLSMFGEAGAFLDRNREFPPRPADAVYITHDLDAPEGVTPPKLRMVAPHYPAGAVAFLSEGTIAVEFVITKEGVIKDPRVLKKHPHPALTYAALDSIRRWTARPATRNGVPVDTIFYIEFIYVLR
jgi:TonB family protein